MKSDLQEYSYLWDGSQEGWILIVAPELSGGHAIFNERSSVLMHIDDPSLSKQLCERMKVAGCKIVARIPEMNRPATVTRTPTVDWNS